MGGVIIALAMQRWNLHRRIAMNIVKVVGFSPGRLIFGFMAANSGYVSIPQMAKSGLGLNLIGIALVIAVTYVLILPTFGVVIGEIPNWAQVIPK